MKKLLSIILTIVILGLLVGGVYYYMTHRNLPALSTQSTTTGGVVAMPGAAGDINKEFLSLLLNIRSIKLDGSVFQNRGFTSLSDTSIILAAPDNIGRRNPFAPIGSDVAPVQNTPVQ